MKMAIVRVCGAGLVAVSFAVLATACGGGNDNANPTPAPTATAWARVEPNAMTPAQHAQQTAATDARDAMMARLLKTLQDTMAAKGPAEAISVCRIDAPAIAESVGVEKNLRIGRTSFKLRNPANTPPSWGSDLVANRVEGPAFFAGPDGQLGAWLPIKMGAPCVTCHGKTEAIPSDVKLALTEHYPQDAATGFEIGDLRGWFWVEVPAKKSSD